MTPVKFLSRAALFSALSIATVALSSGSAFGAESYASSMAGGMPESGAQMNASTMAGESGSNQSSGMSSSLSETQRSTGASGYNSSMTGGPGPGVVVRNIATDTAMMKNTMAKSDGSKTTAANGLIENAVKQKPSDFVPTGTAASAPNSGAVNISGNSASNTNNSSASINYSNSRSSTSTNSPAPVAKRPTPQVKVWNRH